MFEARDSKDIGRYWAKHYTLKVREMRGKELELLMILYGDTVDVGGIFTKRAQNWRRNFCLTQSPPPAFLSLQMLMQRRSRTKTTKARNHSFVFFHLFFLKCSPFSRSLPLHEPMSVHRSLAKAAVWKQTVMLVPARVRSLRVQAGAADSAPKQRPDKQKPRHINFVHCGHTSARCIADCSADSRYRRGCAT